MKKLYCTEPACKNWILTDAEFKQARNFGWVVWRATPGWARCPAQHSGVRIATVGEIRAALRGLPAGQNVTLSDPLASGEAAAVATLVSAGKRARNLDNFPDQPKKGP